MGAFPRSVVERQIQVPRQIQSSTILTAHSPQKLRPHFTNAGALRVFGHFFLLQISWV
jgi:hypothetical protein